MMHRLIVITSVLGCIYISSFALVFDAGKSQEAFTLPGKCLNRECLSNSSQRRSSSNEAASFVDVPPLEIHPLIINGASDNRVDLMFFSDGYTESEKDKFIQDATRLANDVSSNQTFSTVKPLLNFWAAFAASNESGIGVGGVPKDTPFGLYRDGTELRAVYYSKPEVARAACDSKGTQCDYPILLGNDPYYGGLGGDFTVITSSILNGPLVLRHELGHSIINVGEEYDGGFAYFGPNAAHNLSEPLPWTHWLTHPPKHGEPVLAERSVMPLQAYPWTLLNTTTSWSTAFSSSGLYSRHVVRFSLSGLPSSTDLKIELDGTTLQWTPKEDIGLDRWHYDIHIDKALKEGTHQVAFTLLNQERQGVAQLCSVEILEFGSEKEFVSTPGYYGAFPTFSDKNETSYRPTNEDCLMRIVTSPNFCKVCIEGLWLSLLKNVSLIDGVEESCEPTFDPPTGRAGWKKNLDAWLVPLAQFRSDGSGARNHESYTITWRKGDKVLGHFTNKTRLELDGLKAVGMYSLDVTFVTDEIRMDRGHLTTSSFSYTVEHNCLD